MKEKLYTIPLIDAFKSEDECPFCFIERSLEQHSIHFVLGSGASYMEEDIRSQTDQLGFCRTHYQKLYDYGNRLGCGLILSTHLKKKIEELSKLIQNHKREKIRFFKRRTKTNSIDSNPLSDWIQEQNNTCYICNHIKDTYQRYLDSFFELYKKEPQFQTLVKNCNGFCITHFHDLITKSVRYYSNTEYQDFYKEISSLMLQNLQRVQDDIQWFCEKFDYRNKDKDWKNSKDALQRSMQKMAGGHPADPPFTQDL